MSSLIHSSSNIKQGQGSGDSEVFDLGKYIKNSLKKTYRPDVSKCLREIGQAFDQYTDYDCLLNKMTNESIRELEESISRIKFDRKRFTRFITCGREEAAKHSAAYFTYGEFGGDYGYFENYQQFTEQQKEWLEEYTECCYYNGQPCGRHQHEQHNDYEDCECVLGREYSSLVMYELDEEEEKRLDVWKQEVIWYLTTDYQEGEENEERIRYSSHERYYSLHDIKKSSLEYCHHQNKEKNKDCPDCEKIFAYEGKNPLITGNIYIRPVTDDEC
jgi:hypothetical protein